MYDVCDDDDDDDDAAKLIDFNASSFVGAKSNRRVTLLDSDGE